MRIRIAAGLGAALLVMGTGTLGFAQETTGTAAPAATGAAQAESGPAKLGIEAKPLQIKEWVKGTSVTLSEGKGEKVYVVEFWATWCPPCRASIPHLSELQKKYRDKGVVIVGISDEDPGKVRPFVETQGDKMDYVVAIDDQDKTSNEYMKPYQVRGIPHAFIVDKTGKIAWHGHPMSNLDKVLDEVLAGTYDMAAAQRALDAGELANKYVQLVRQDSADAKAIGEQVLKDGDANLLNQVAWEILTSSQIKNRDLDLALRMAEKAAKASENKSATILDTYARALFDSGKVDEAIRTQKEAVKLAESDREREELEKNLKQFEEKKGKE